MSCQWLDPLFGDGRRDWEIYKVVVVGDFNFRNIDRDLLGAKGLDRAVYIRCIQEGS